MLTEERRDTRSFQRRSAIVILFSVCLLFFLERGPYRAIRINSYDFSTLYASTRCWAKGENPYDRAELKQELAVTGAPDRLIYQQNLNPPVYLLSAMPIIDAVAWLPWGAANVSWSLLSLTLFALSLVTILNRAQLSSSSKWIVASLSLAFCPTYVGLLGGNPSVISISLLALSICLSLDGRPIVSGVLLAVTMCVKPQIAICGVCILTLWKQWESLLLAFCGFATAGFIGALRGVLSGHLWEWWQSERQNMALQFGPGGAGDPRANSSAAFQFLDPQPVVAYFIQDPLLRTALLWIFAAAMTMLYLRLRNKAGVISRWKDVGFFSAMSIVVTYHRYCDGQIFLLLIPFLVHSWKANHRNIAIALGVCLLAIAFPDQSVFATWLGPDAFVPSLAQFVLLRHQPLAVLAIGMILALSWPRKWLPAQEALS